MATNTVRVNVPLLLRYLQHRGWQRDNQTGLWLNPQGTPHALTLDGEMIPL